jgi:predicted metal-dependent phosphotriesterase family hydrolase
MSLTLAHSDLWLVELRLEQRLIEALDANWSRAIQNDSLETFNVQLSLCMASAISHVVDMDLQMPSERQVKFVTDIARELGLDIPAEVLQYRGACAEFLNRFVDAFRSKRSMRHAIDPFCTKE